MRTSPPLVVLALGGVAECWGCPESASPLAQAATPHLDRIAGEGRVFGVQFRGDPASVAPLVSLLGLDPAVHESATASYRGLAMGEVLGEGECFASADFVALFRDMVADAEPGPLRSAEADALFEVALESMERAGIRLIAGEDTHHIAVAQRASIDGRLPGPMFALGRELTAMRPATEQHAMAHQLGRDALDGHEINEVRRELGDNGADMLWLWGPGGAPQLRVDASGWAAFGTDPVWAGLCLAAKLERKAQRVKTVTGLVRAVGQAMTDHSVCFVHDNRCVSDALRREQASREEGLAALDADLIGPLVTAIGKRGGRLLVVPDAAWSTKAGHPSNDPVPALFWGAGINTLSTRPFTEAAAALAGEPVSPGHGLLEYVQRF